MIQLGQFYSQLLFEFVQISDEYFEHLLANIPHICNQLESNLANLEATVTLE